MRRALVLSSAILAVALGADTAGAQCPASSGTCFAPTWEPVGFGYCQPRFSGPLSQQFDLRQGLLEVTGHGAGADPGYSTLVVEDEFVIGGVGTGDTVRCQLRIEVQGQLGCSSGGFAAASCSVRDSEGAALEFLERIQSSTESPSPYLPIMEVHVLDLAWTGGTPRRLHTELAVSGRSGGGSATVRYRFVGLPPGATLQSCHGFVNESPTRVARASWGSLRMRYR